MANFIGNSLRRVIEATPIPQYIDLNRFSSDDDEGSLLSKAWNAATYPFRLATSRTAIRIYLTCLLFTATSFILLSISTTAYGLFYYNFIPPINLERPIYLQYDAGQHPHAELPLRTTSLISQQPYDINIVLHMPRTPANLAAGNFMLDLTLHTNIDRIEVPLLKTLGMNNTIPSSALHHSRRPAILPYESHLNGLASTLLTMPFHLTTLHDSDSTTLTIPMFEEISFARGKTNVPTWIELRIQSQSALTSTALPSGDSTALVSAPPSLQIYSAKITFAARFHGLRYLIYNHRIISFIVFTSLFYTVSISSLGIAWALITAGLSILNNQQTPQQKKLDDKRNVKQESSAAPKIKNEPSDSESTTDILSTLTDSKSLRQPVTIAEETEISPVKQEPTSVQTVLAPGEAADDEQDLSEEEDEDEWEQLQRLRQQMVRQREMAHDSGIGTSLESSGPSREGVSRRRSAGASGSRGRERQREEK